MSNIGGIIKSIQTIMWQDTRLNGDAQRIEQLGWMLFLKIFSDKDKELELLDEKYKSPIPDKYHWVKEKGNWATERLKEYIIKGFTLDDERLKNQNNIFGKDYFEEQLARIRDIRSSERRFYQKITDIYTQCSADYNVETQATKDFFATVQNKLHWAITRQTAAEIIYTDLHLT